MDPARNMSHRASCTTWRNGFCKRMTTASLASLSEGYRAIIFGASGGVGHAVVRSLAADPRCGNIIAASRTATGIAGAESVPFDLECEDSIASCLAKATQEGPLDLIIVATGLLHGAGMKPEKSWRALDADALARSFRVNAIGPALIAKHALEHLPKDRKSVFAALSARVGSISDNRLGGWHGYRSSKAALNMMVRNFALELERRNPLAVCVTFHPGTVDTDLSKPFRSGAKHLFTPEQSAAHLLRVIDRLEPADTGQLIAWDGSVIPY